MLATAETLAIMAVRYGEAFTDERQVAEIGREIMIAGWVSHSFPQAMCWVRPRSGAVEGLTIVASGDYKREADPTAMPFEVVPCDVFITEATFGLPVFRHPPARGGRQADRIAAAVSGAAHLVGAYSLGKAQRVMALARQAGFDGPIHLHGAMEKLTAFYQAHGIDLGETRKVAGLDKAALRGALVLCPPSAIQDVWSRRFPDPVTAFASGWMRIRARARQKGVELPMIISDHADWDDLRRTILETGRRNLGHPWPGGCAGPLVPDAGTQGQAAAHGGLWRRGRGGARGARDGTGRMNRFAALLDALAYEPRRNAKLALMARYFRETPDPERGVALAALTGALTFREAKPAMIRQLVAERVDPVLFAISYDYVGDLSETAALIWPAERGINAPPPGLAEVVETLATLPKRELPQQLARWLDGLDETGRWALLKLITGGLRVGVSARLARTAVAMLGPVEPDEVELVCWHGLRPPYLDLFAWLEGRARNLPAAIRLRSGRSCSRIRWRMRTWRASMPSPSSPNGNGTGSGCRPWPGATRPGNGWHGSIRAAARRSPARFPMSPRRWITRARSMANCSSSAPPSPELQTPCSSAQPQGGEREAADGEPGAYPSL